MLGGHGSALAPSVRMASSFFVCRKTLAMVPQLCWASSCPPHASSLSRSRSLHPCNARYALATHGTPLQHTARPCNKGSYHSPSNTEVAVMGYWRYTSKSSSEVEPRCFFAGDGAALASLPSSPSSSPPSSPPSSSSSSSSSPLSSRARFLDLDTGASGTSSFRACSSASSSSLSSAAASKSLSSSLSSPNPPSSPLLSYKLFCHIEKRTKNQGAPQTEKTVKDLWSTAVPG